MAKNKYTNFHDFLKLLDKIRQDGRKEAAEIRKRWEIAQQEHERVYADANASDLDRQLANLSYRKAKEVYETAGKELDRAVEQRIADLRGEMAIFVRELYRVTPERMDKDAIELLKSGIMSASDMEYMAEQHRSNPTMLKMIGKYAAEKRRDETLSDETRFSYVKLSVKLRDVKDGTEAFESFDNLSVVAKKSVSTDKWKDDTWEGHWDKFYGMAESAYNDFIVQPGQE